MLLVRTTGRRIGKIAALRKEADMKSKLGEHVHYISPGTTYCNKSCPSTTDLQVFIQRGI
jgi:hypothetical protein